jgi:hypothetical protein
LNHLRAVNIGAAGTFVIRKPVSRARLRAELASRLPFEAEIVMCEGDEILDLMARDHFSGHALRPDVVRFVSVLSRPARSSPRMPVSFPSSGQWLVRVLATESRFVVGLYRRHMRSIGYLGALDRVFGVPLTTRNWNTIAAIAKVLDSGGRDGMLAHVRRSSTSGRRRHA